MTTLTIAEVQAQLPQLIDQLKPGEEVVIVRADKPVARLVVSTESLPTAGFGGCKGMITQYIDDDEHLRDFAEYMP